MDLRARPGTGAGSLVARIPGGSIRPAWSSRRGQISAATRALQAVAVGLLEDHLRHCVVEAAAAGDATDKVKEASQAIARLVRS